jgi:hypothetical protein
MFPIAFVIIYAIVFIWCIYRFHYFQAIALNKRTVTAIFLIKIAIGLLYGYIHQYYFDGGDTFLYHEESIRIASTFFEYPSYYINSILGYAPTPPEGADVYIYPESFFIQKDLGTYVLVHIHAITQFFAFGSYQIHAVFIAFLSLIASLNMYKIYSKLTKEPSNLLIVLTFFLPSVLFWTAGFHKDLWVYLGLSWLMTGLLGLYQGQKLGSSLLMLSLGLATVGCFRYYLLVLLFPAVIGYLWTIYSPQPRAILRYASTYFGLLVFVSIFSYTMSIDVFGVLSAKQAEFLAEKGGSSIMHLVPWEPNLKGFLFFMPDAITNAAFRPFFWNCRDFLQYLAAFEISVFWIFGLYALRHFRVFKMNWHPLNYFMLTYALSNLLLIGYLVGNLGTIVRYRSIAIGFLAIIFLQAYLKLRKNKQSKANRSTAKVGLNKELSEEDIS